MPTRLVERQDRGGDPDGRRCDSHRPADAPIDWDHLSRFTLNDKALEYEVLGLFAMDAPRYLAKMHAARGRKDWIEAAHTLKGSARAVGAWAVAECAEAAEKLQLAVRGESPDPAGSRGIAEVLQRLSDAVCCTVAYIEKLVDPARVPRAQ